MKIVFRVDSSSLIGSGHLMRCLVLAERFKKLLGAWIYFIVRDLQGNLNSVISDREFEIRVLPTHNLKSDELIGYDMWLSVPQLMDAEDTKNALIEIQDVNLLVVDSYAISSEWESHVRNSVKKLMVIDDLANRIHECDYILDQSYCGEKTQRYNNLIPDYCKAFFGVSYVLLHESYYLLRAKVRTNIHNILVFFGGGDDTGETLKFLSVIQKVKYDSKFLFTVVVGDGNPNKDSIRVICNELNNVLYYCQVDNMAELIMKADIAFGAAGSNVWERCFLGLPSVVTVTADNQRFVAEQINCTGAIKLLGWHEAVYAGTYEKALSQIEKLPIETMSKAALSVVGRSCVDEMIKTIQEDLQ